MGCTQSKIDNEEAVSRCKDRKHHMKDAVSSRNAFAAAHSAFSMSLKNTGAALSDFAPGESHHHPNPNPHNSLNLNHNHNHNHIPSPISVPAVAQPSSESIFQPPPRPDFDTASTLPPLSRAATMPQISLPKQDQPLLSTTDAILEEEDEDDDGEAESVDSRLRTRGRRIGKKINRRTEKDIEDEDDGPPPPPSPPPLRRNTPAQPSLTPQMPSSDNSFSWDYFFSHENVPGPSLDDDEDRMGWQGMNGKALEERFRASQEDIANAKPEATEVVIAVEKEVKPPPPAAVVTAPLKAVAVKKGKQVMKGGGGGISLNLVKIFNELDDHFLKASESAHEVSKMLEANRLHYHSNFADNRGHIDHSARVMRVITWNRSFRGLPNQDDMMDDFESEEHETHATVLDKLLAWEKKLYDEVKAGELMKFEYQKKVASLNKQKKRGTNSETLEKAKAAVSHLHTRYIVDMQSLDSTVTEIERLRDKQLYPKLVALVDGMSTMWEAMRDHHAQQKKIATALRALDISQAPKETSEHHHERTIQLWAVVQEWHSQFEKLVTHQKEYIKALNNWLRLNLIPIESSLKEKVSSPARFQNPPIQSLLQAWHDYLQTLPDEGAKSAIFNFAAVINTIVQHQEEEIKLRLRCEESRKELSRKNRQFEDWLFKHKQRRTQPDETEPGDEDGSHDEEVVERRVAIEVVKKRLEEEEEEYQKQCIHVRDKSLVSLRTRLPELFNTLSEFAEGCSQIYSNLRSISRSQKPEEGSS